MSLDYLAHTTNNFNNFLRFRRWRFSCEEEKCDRCGASQWYCHLFICENREKFNWFHVITSLCVQTVVCVWVRAILKFDDAFTFMMGHDLSASTFMFTRSFISFDSFSFVLINSHFKLNYSVWQFKPRNVYKCEFRFFLLLEIVPVFPFESECHLAKLVRVSLKLFDFAIQFRFQIKFLCEYNDFHWNSYEYLYCVLCYVRTSHRIASHITWVWIAVDLKEFAAPHIQLSELFVKLFSGICLFICT